MAVGVSWCVLCEHAWGVQWRTSTSTRRTSSDRCQYKTQNTQDDKHGATALSVINHVSGKAERSLVNSQAVDAITFARHGIGAPSRSRDHFIVFHCFGSETPWTSLILGWHRMGVPRAKCCSSADASILRASAHANVQSAIGLWSSKHKLLPT